MTTTDTDLIGVLAAALKARRHKAARLILADAVIDAGLDPWLSELLRDGWPTAEEMAPLAPYAVKALDAGLVAVREAKVRSAAGETRCPVVIVAGASAAVAVGERGHQTFKDGGVCKFPGAARRAGYKTVYHASTRRVEAGVLWLMAEGMIG